MTIYTLLYVSRALVHGAEAETAVADIVSLSRVRNRLAEVTGALLFTGVHFAQILEGSRAAVKELMVSIERDLRHTEISVIQEGDIPQARFATWALAYSGPSTYIDRRIVQTLAEAAGPERRDGTGLIRLLEEFAAG